MHPTGGVLGVLRNDLRAAVAAVAGPAAGMGDADCGCRFWAVRPVVMSRRGRRARGRPSCRREVCRRRVPRRPRCGAGLAWSDPSSGSGREPDSGFAPHAAQVHPGRGHAMAPARDPLEPYDMYTAFVGTGVDPGLRGPGEPAAEGHLADQAAVHPRQPCPPLGTPSLPDPAPGSGRIDHSARLTVEPLPARGTVVSIMIDPRHSPLGARQLRANPRPAITHRHQLDRRVQNTGARGHPTDRLVPRAGAAGAPIWHQVSRTIPGGDEYDGSMERRIARSS